MVVGLRAASRASADANQLHLAGRLALVEARVRRLLEQNGRFASVDPLGSIAITPTQIERLLADAPDCPDEGPTESELAAEAERMDEEATAFERQGADVRLTDLARRFRLSRVDLELLCVALAPELDGRFGRLFAYLQDDFSARRATVSLALELLGRSPLDVDARARLHAGAPLVDGGLLALSGDDVPLLQRQLVVPDRVVMHVLGSDLLDAAVRRHVIQPLPDLLEGAEALAVAIFSRSAVVYLREPAEGIGVAHAMAAFHSARARALAVDVATGIAHGEARMVEATLLDGRLQGAGLIVPHAEKLGPVPGAVDRLCRSARPVVLVGAVPWEAAWSTAVPLCLDLPAPSLDAEQALWRQAMQATGAKVAEGFAGLTGFDLSPAQVARTAEQATQRANYAQRELTEDDLREAARHQNGSAMLSLARRVVPSARWGDLVVSREVRTQLTELLSRVKLAPQVLERWDLRTSTRRGAGIRAMFCGAPGTGKTLAAEVIAGELGLDLFVIDLSSVVDKYIGETEKNLERIFSAASETNGVLFFDEADALFGKRSEVREAKDRYANIETSYLLQRIDAFDGFIVLATNLRSNIDEAFTRRLDVVVEMVMPEAGERLALWDRCLGSRMPRHDDVDLAFLATSFELSGGSIRNIALTAAFFAAEGDGCLHMEDLIWGVQREYRKLGRLSSASEFGPWWELVSG